MPKSVSPHRAITRMALSCGDKLSAREVERTAAQLQGSVRRIEEMETSLRQNADTYGLAGAGHVDFHLFRERQELAGAAVWLERIGAGEPLPRRLDYPETLGDALETVPVTPKARGVAARHGALLQAFLAGPGTTDA